MNRAIAALFASSISSIITYPLDTLFVTTQFKKKPQNYYSGLKIDLVCTPLSTCIFFQTYEKFLTSNNAATASIVSTFTSSAINVPLNILKRKSQTSINIQEFNFVKTSFFDKFKNIYFITCAKKIPKNMIKYSIYENSLKVLWPYFSPSICGGLSALFSSLISNMIIFPIETSIIKVSCGIHENIFDFFRNIKLNELYNGFFMYILYSVTSNVIGHSILELISPRYITY